jgi:hypothetical protein
MNHMQAAFQESQARFQSGYAALLQAQEEGKFAAVAESPAFCPSTDALMGCHYSVLGTFNTRKEAETYLLSRMKDFYSEDSSHDEDTHLYVFPRMPVTCADMTSWASDIPF